MKYSVAVRALCEFTARSGDLDLRFTPAPTALEGMEGHAAVRSRRSKDYESEISLSCDYRELTVRGRADGYDPRLNRLEEIKTYRGRLDAMPENHRALHWAQAKVYAHLLCAQRGLPEIHVALVYYDIVERKETVLTETCGADALARHFHLQCDRYADWAESELRHRSARDRYLEALRFPHGAFRPGQRQLAETVYKAARAGRCVLAQAPTGIGKTAATLFPMLKACVGGNLDKVFFLTAKTTGRRLALDTLAMLAGPQEPGADPRLRMLELTAREKACEHPDRACHGASCPLAEGFYDRLPAARRQACSLQMLDRDALRGIAREHRICPYWLSHDLAQWSDVIVGDYNYYFDSSALLHSLSAARQWRAGVLVDEAHNLLERARGMYSIELRETELYAARDAAPAVLRKAFTPLLRSWRACHRDQADSYRAYPDIPAQFHAALLRTSAAIAQHMDAADTPMEPALQRFYFDILHFLRLAESFGAHSIFDIKLAQPPGKARLRAALSLRNMIPAPFLAPRFGACHSAILFSATLTPVRFYLDTLGLPGDTAGLDVESPFKADQLQLRISRRISTRYTHRRQSLGPIAALMAVQYREKPGNYLSYFSSFDYLSQAADEFARRFPDIPIWRQSPGMSETEREKFLARFREGGSGIGFAVLGGAFAEGVDLPGSRLIGAFVSTLGLPQVNPVNEQLKQCMGTVFGAERGYDYAYLYPGLQKVVQAAGRVIRSCTDSGVLHLIDDRYGQARIQALLPRWWRLEYGDGAAALQPYRE